MWSAPAPWPRPSTTTIRPAPPPTRRRGRSPAPAATTPDPATSSISGDTSVNEGSAASYTVHLAGTLQSGENAHVDLGLADIDTTSADYASFAAAVNAAIGARTDVSFASGVLTYTGDGSPMADLVISLGTTDDTLVEGPEQYKVSLANPGSNSGANVVGTGSVTTTINDTNPA